MLQPLIADKPFGVFDALDTEVTSCKGGEVATLSHVNVNSTDKAAKDVSDGYFNTSDKKRPVATKSLVSGNRPLFLVDDGTTGYGLIYGVVVGGTAGSVVSGGAVLGPHTATGSGKWTLWMTPGLFAVTLDAVDTTASTGLVPTNTTVKTGDALYATAAGLLTPNAGSAFESIVVGRFVEFATNGSLVATPDSLAAAANSPSSDLVTALNGGFTRAVFTWSPEL